MVFENRVLRKIFGPKRQKVTGDCIMRCFVTFIISGMIHVDIRMRWVRHVARMGGEERCVQSFGGEN
jgi:hypothetical protein